MSLVSGGLRHPTPSRQGETAVVSLVAATRVRRVIAAASVAAAAYVAGRRHQLGTPEQITVSSPRPTTSGPADELTRLDRRLSELEQSVTARPSAPAARRPGRHDKPYTVFHYESLARQVAHERQIAELSHRLGDVDRSGSDARVVRLATWGGEAAGERRRV